MPLSPAESPQQSIKRYQPVTQSWLISKVLFPNHRRLEKQPHPPWVGDCLRTFVLCLWRKSGENFLKAMAKLKLHEEPEEIHRHR